MNTSINRRFSLERFAILFFSLVIIFGFFLRWNGITKNSLWFDELFSVVHSTNAQSVTDLLYRIKHDYHPPGYQIILYYWIRLLGNSEFSVRFLSAISNIISVVAVGVLFFRKFNKSLLYSITLTASLSANYILLFFSQETRSYIFLASVGPILVLLTLMQIRDKENSNPYYSFLLILGLVFNSWLHFLGLFWSLSIIGVSFLYNLFRKNGRQSIFWIIALLFVMISFTPWIIFSVTDIKIHPLNHIPPVGFSFSLILLLNFYALGSILILPLLLAILFKEIRKNSKNESFFITLAIISLFLLGLVFLQSFANLPMINVKNVIVLSPIILLLPFLADEPQSKWRGAFYISVALIALLQIVSYIESFRKIKKEEFREAATIALRWKTELLQNDKNADIRFAALRADFFSYYLPQEKLLSCEKNKKFDPTETVKADSYLIYVWGHNGPYGEIIENHCLFPGYLLKKKEIGLHSAGAALFKKQ